MGTQGCPIDGLAMTIDGMDRIHAVWFTQIADMPRLYLASSADRGASFTKPLAFDSTQKLAKHARIVPVPGKGVLIAWDDTNGSAS